MNREAICTGKTVEEALEKAYAELGANSDNSEFEILERPARKLFGLKVIPAKVKVTMTVPDEPAKAPAAARPAATRAERPAPQRQPQKPRPEASKQPPREKAEPRQEAPERPAVPEGTPATGEKVDCAVGYLKAIFREMGLENVEIKATAAQDGAVLTLSGEGLGVLIGRRGETLDALQYLSGLVANRLEGDYFRITIDSGNYREKREKTLEQLARKLSGQVVKTGRNLTLEPMNPYERRIIHATVQTIEGVTSASIGEEPNRRVVISSTAPRKRREGGPNRGGGRGPAPRGGRGGKGGGGGKPRDNRGPRPAGGSQVVTRPGAFDGSMKAAAPKKRIDDSAIEIDPPVRTPLPKAESKPQGPKNQPPEEVKDKPLYSKIEID